MAELINETNLSTGTYQKVISVDNLCNILFQYKLIAGEDNTIEIQFWGTSYTDATSSTDDDWVNITEFLTEEEILSVTNDTVHDFAITDSQCPFAEIKVKYIITTSSPDNTVKIGWHSDK